MPLEFQTMHYMVDLSKNIVGNICLVQFCIPFAEFGVWHVDLQLMFCLWGFISWEQIFAAEVPYYICYLWLILGQQYQLLFQFETL